VILKKLQQRTKGVIWRYDNIERRIEGRITVRDYPGILNVVLKSFRHTQAAIILFFGLTSSGLLRVPNSTIFPLFHLSFFLFASFIHGC